MKILIINSVLDFGSTGRICLNAAKYFSKLGYEVKIAYGRFDPSYKSSETFGYRIGSKKDLFCHALLTRMFDIHGFGSKIATKKFLTWADEFNPDIVWLHNLHGYYINVKLLFKWLKKRDLKVFWTLHDCWSFTGHCSHFSFVGCEQWVSGCKKCPQKKEYPASFVSKAKNNYLRKKEIFTSLSDLTIITPSMWLKELVSRSFLKKYPIEVINNGIDFSSFYFKTNNDSHLSEKHQKTIMCISSFWNERKGLGDVIKLSSMLFSDERIVLIGKLPDGLKLAKNIYYIPRTNDLNELRNIYTSSDVMFNPTYEDTYSNINMESLICHTPVVCYKTCGAYEMLDNRFVVNQGDLTSALKIMREVFSGKLNYDFSNTSSFSEMIALEKYKNLLFK